MLVNLQQLWDFVNVIESCVGSWKKTAWKRLDVEEIEQQCKRFSKDIRSLGKLIRSWQPFVYIEKVLKNLVTSLRAITELQNQAIKDRHWLELMKSTGVRINRLNASFSFKFHSILNLDLVLAIAQRNILDIHFEFYFFAVVLKIWNDLFGN